MEAVVLNLMWIFECLMIIICLHIAFALKIYPDFKLTGILVCNNVLFMLHYRCGKIPKICAYAGYILMFFYFCRKSEKKMLNKILRFVFGILLAGIIEISVMLISVFFVNMKGATSSRLLISSLCSLAVSCLLYLVLFNRKKNMAFNIQDRKTVLGLLCFSATTAVLLLDFMISHIMNILENFMLWLLCSSGFFYVLIFEKKNCEVKTKEEELLVHRKYAEAYEELQSEVRKAQHDYKNRLAVMQSMSMTAGTLEELMNMQNIYREDLKKDSVYEQIMTGCSNVILAGYIYQKYREIRKSEISINLKIRIMQAESSLKISELIEILGILLDNACEYLKERKDRVIFLELLETEKSISVKVSNPAEYYSSGQIEKFFLKGYSTKGENRGIGLFRLKELADEKKAELRIFNGERKGTNLMEFFILIRK